VAALGAELRAILLNKIYTILRFLCRFVYLCARSIADFWHSYSWSSCLDRFSYDFRGHGVRKRENSDKTYDSLPCIRMGDQNYWLKWLTCRPSVTLFSLSLTHTAVTCTTAFTIIVHYTSNKWPKYFEVSEQLLSDASKVK